MLNPRQTTECKCPSRNTSRLSKENPSLLQIAIWKICVKPKPIPTFTEENCKACKKEKHPLYSCSKFRSLSHEEKIASCWNRIIIVSIAYVLKDCKSLHRCKQCQRPHHSLLHIDGKDIETPVNHAAVRIQSDLLLMTCQVLVESPQALLDSGSSASFASERIAQHLRLRRCSQSAKICGIAGLSSGSHNQPTSRLHPFTLPQGNSTWMIYLFI